MERAIGHRLGPHMSTSRKERVYLILGTQTLTRPIGKQVAPPSLPNPSSCSLMATPSTRGFKKHPLLSQAHPVNGLDMVLEMLQMFKNESLGLAHRVSAVELFLWINALQVSPLDMVTYQRR